MKPVLTSAHNPRVAAARKLLRGKERAAAGAFLVEGPHAVGEALVSAKHRVRELFVTPAAAEREVGLLRRAAAADVAVTLVDERAIRTLGETVTPQGVVAVVTLPATSLEQVLAARPTLVAVLCGVADPGNAGAVLRIADAMAADAVVIAGGGVDPHNGKCVRASAGSLFHLPVVRVTDAASVLLALKSAGLRVLATALRAAASLDDLGEDLALPTAWVFGSEAHGVPDDVLALADRTVHIPMPGRAESLNLAAAAAICLHATARQRRR